MPNSIYKVKLNRSLTLVANTDTIMVVAHTPEQARSFAAKENDNASWAHADVFLIASGEGYSYGATVFKGLEAEA